MKKITVSICAGTSCYVMGGSELLLLEEYMTEEQRQAVEMEGSPCFGFCREHTFGKSPFVTVNGERIEKATIQTVLERIDTLLKEEN
jgi:NADH:ubiquinone oxidoreductase subunit E